MSVPSVLVEMFSWVQPPKRFLDVDPGNVPQQSEFSHSPEKYMNSLNNRRSISFLSTETT